MENLKQQFIANQLRLLSLSVVVFCLVAHKSWAAPACQDVQGVGNPIGEQRFSPTFSETTESSCQSGNPEFYVTDEELYQEILFNEETDFCPKYNDQNSTQETQICDSNNLFKFSQHSDRLPLFIEKSENLLSKIQLPAEFLETSLSDEERLHYQAIIYFCTRSYSNPLITKLKSKGVPLQERLAALTQLKNSGLLYMFTAEAQRILSDTSVSEELRKAILFAFLDSGNLAQPFLELRQRAARVIKQIEERSEGKELNPRMAERLTQQKKILSSLEGFFSDYIQAEHQDSQLPALRSLAGADVEGAAEATLILERKISAKNPNTGEAGPSRSIASVSQPEVLSPIQIEGPVNIVLHARPTCTGDQAARISPEEYQLIEQLIHDSNANISHEEINFTEKFFESYDSDADWTNLALVAPENLNNFSKFYCFHKRTKEALSNLENLTTQEADQLYSDLSGIPDSISNLGAVVNLLPKLSRAKYLEALELLAVSSNNLLAVDEFKAESLYNEFQRISQNGSNLEDRELITAIISALGSNSGFSADEKLSQIFRDNADDPLRMAIIQAYSNPAFARFGSRLNIFHTLFDFSPEQRKPYAEALSQVVQDNYSQLQDTGGSNTSSGSLSASEGQINAALAAVMALNSNRTGDLNDGLEQVLTSDGVTRIRTRNAPVVERVRNIVRIQDPDIRAETERAQAIADATLNAQQNQKEEPKSNPFEAFNKILEDNAKSESSDEFIPDAEYLARVTGEKSQRDRIGRQDAIDELPPIEEQEDPFDIDTSPDGSNRESRRPSSAGDQSFNSEVNAQDEFNTNNIASNSGVAAPEPFKGQTQQPSELQKQINNLEKENSRLITSIKNNDLERGTLNNNLNNQGPQAQRGRGSARSSTNSAGPSRAIASASGASAQAPTSGSTNSIPTSRLASSDLAAAPKKKKQETIVNEPLLSPRQQLNRNERGNVIKIVDESEKLQFLDYMSTRNDFSCEELDFIEKFYKENLSYFFQIKDDTKTVQFANVEIDLMNYRFDFPGQEYIAIKRQENCNKEKNSVANTDGETAQEEQDGAPSRRSPASSGRDRKPSAPRQSIQDLIFNKFKEKFGL